MTYTDELAARVTAAEDERGRIVALLELGNWLAYADPNAAIPWARQALAAAQQFGDAQLLAVAHRVHAHATLFTSGPRVAFDELKAAHYMFTELADPAGVAWCQLFLGVTLEFLGDPGGATVQLDRARIGFRSAHDRSGQAHVFIALANGQFVLEHFDEAAALLHQAQELAQHSNDLAALGLARAKLGEMRAKSISFTAQNTTVERVHAQFVAALAELRAAYEHAVEVGYASLEPSCLYNQVLPLVQLGRADEAISIAEQALAKAGMLGLDHRVAGALHHAGIAHFMRGDTRRAIGYLKRADALYQQWDLTHDTVAILRLLVQTYERAGDINAALTIHKRLLTAELRLRDHLAERADQIAVARFEAERSSELSEEGRLRLQQLVRVNRRLVDERKAMERLAHTDPLTGLANRRHFDAQFGRLLVQSELSGEPVSLVLIDVDHFKRINDRYSHLVGDNVLRMVATDLMRHCRVSDLPCRIGGEEFAVLLPATGSSEALAIAQRLRISISEIDASHLAPGLHATVSAGVASSIGGDTVSMMAAADKALYYAKAAGRNRVFLAAEPPFMKATDLHHVSAE